MAVENPTDTMHAGNRRVLRYTVVDEAGLPLNLSGFTAQWALTRFPSTTPVIERSSAGGTITIVPATGVVDVILTEGLTAALEGYFRAELEIVDGSGNSNVVANGGLIIKRNVSNT